MFHKVKSVTPLKDYKLSVQFSEGITKRYDVKPLFKRFKIFNNLKAEKLFNKVHHKINLFHHSRWFHNHLAQHELY